ncbi:MAG: PAS domain S-box protein [Ignavibacteriota bacterium]
MGERLAGEERSRELVAISLTLRDVTGIKEMEREKSFLASIVESSEDAIFAMRPDGTVMSWNRGAEALLGYSSREAIGREFGIVVLERRIEAVLRHLEIVRQGQGGRPI